MAVRLIDDLREHLVDLLGLELPASEFGRVVATFRGLDALSAEDFCQAIFLECLEKRPQSVDEIYLAAHRIRERIRRRAKRDTVCHEDLSVFPAPDQQDASTAAVNALQRLAESLSPEAVAVLERLLDGMSQTQVAAELGISQPTVSRLVAHIRSCAMKTDHFPA